MTIDRPKWKGEAEVLLYGASRIVLNHNAVEALGWPSYVRIQIDRRRGRFTFAPVNDTRGLVRKLNLDSSQGKCSSIELLDAFGIDGDSRRVRLRLEDGMLVGQVPEVADDHD